MERAVAAASPRLDGRLTDQSYLPWRDWKSALPAPSLASALVEVGDPAALRQSERQAVLAA